MQISVIIPTFNSGEKIRRCLDALQRQKTKRSYEIIVVDDGSTDTSLQDIDTNNHKIKIYSQLNQGPAAARNLGVEKAQGKIILFTDADCEPAEDWIEQMARPLDDPSISGVKGAYLTRQKGVVARFVQAEYESKYEKMKRDRFIDFIDTYSAGFDKWDFLTTGKYDTRFSTPSVEDQEFSFRMWEKGYRMVFNPQAKVYHTHIDSFLGYMKKKFRIGFWKALVLKEHPDKVVRDSHTPQSLKLEMVFSTLFLTFLLLWPFNKLFLSLAGLTLAGFFITILPFWFRTFRSSFTMAFYSPLLLFLRAVSLSAGLMAGAEKLIFQQQERKTCGIKTKNYSQSKSQIIFSD